MRQPILIVVLLLIGALTYGTIEDAREHGVSILTVFSVLVLALFAFGIVGALREPPE